MYYGVLFIFVVMFMSFSSTFPFILLILAKTVNNDMCLFAKSSQLFSG